MPCFTSIAADSHRGHLRKRNEDDYRCEPAIDGLVVADGLGGHAAGDVAAGVAVETVTAFWREREGADAVDAVLAANQAVHAAAYGGGGAPGMGCTLVVARLVDDALHCAWVGDSRAYLWRQGSLRQLSRDHSYVQSLVDAGCLSDRDAAVHPERNVLTRFVGGTPLYRSEVGAAVVPAEAGDRVLLCTDGLTGELAPATIAACLGEHGDDHEAVAALIERALAAGGRDNVTLALATVGAAAA